MTRLTILSIFILLVSGLHAQSILDQYVEQALEKNLQVREKEINERKQKIRLDEASRLYGPEIGFFANYTLATGGRNIALPVGSLLNPVYAELNDIIDESKFPMIEDQSISFLPNNFYDAKVRITQPIFRPEIKYNKLIKSEELTLAGLQTDQAKRDLIRDVKTSYLRWMQAKEAISIFDQGLALLVENKRVTESLIKNGLAIPSSRIRIESDIEVLEAQKRKAESDLRNAASYFNFLLQQPPDTPIAEDTFPYAPDIPVMMDVTAREELQQLKTGHQIQSLALTLEQKHFAPTLGVQLDLGSQAYGTDWGGYVLGGLGLEIPIWDNKKSKLRQQAWNADLESNQVSYEWTKQAFEVQLQSEIENLRSDIMIYDSYTSLIASNTRYQQETLRRYKEGLANYIELLDARTQVTNAQLEQNLAKYQSWIRRINIERISASSIID